MRSEWPHSQLLGRSLEAAELECSGIYMTIHVGGPLDGDVTLTADVAAQQVAVGARWRTASSRRQAQTPVMPMAGAEMLAAQWADELGTGHEPSHE